jgi:putative PIN family toxin of toxin-antitoxin system
MRIVLDTNCLLVIVPKQSQFRILFDKILAGKFKLVITTEILLEYEEQLSKFYSSEYAKLIINAICNLPQTIEVNPIYFNWLLIKNDNDDNKFVDAYLAGQAEYIITNDKHFQTLSKIEFPKVFCMKLNDFIKI